MELKQNRKGFRARVAEYFYEDVPLDHGKGRKHDGKGKAAKGPAAPAAPDEFGERARKLLEKFPDPRLTAGKLQVLGLYGLRKNAATEWDEISDEVQDLMASAMERHLHPSDVYTRYDDETFLVLFCQRDMGEAKARTDSIAKEANSSLKRHLAKTLPRQKAARDAINVQGEVAEIDCAQPCSGGKIFDVIANGLGVTADGAADGPAAGRGVNGQPLSGQEDAAIRTPHNGQHHPQWAPGGAAGNRPADAPRKYGAPRERALRGHIFEPSANDIAEEAEVAPDDRERQSDARLSGAPLVYQPVWGAVQSVVSTYACALPPATSANPMPDMSQADRDRMLLGNIIRGFETFDHRKSSGLLIAPVDFQTLTGISTREKYLELCQRLPSSNRKFMLFEIFNLAGYAPWPEANRVWQELQPYCLSIIVRLPLENPQMAGIETPKLYAFSTDLGHLDGKAVDRRSDIVSFVGAAEAAGLRTLAHGIDRAPVAKWALSAGVAYLSGEAIAPGDISPKPAYSYDPFR